MSSSQTKMPVLFLGHGSPMNAIEHNSFTQKLTLIGSQLGRPKAILCVSAHWVTEGTQITAATTPKIIYDFYGFPDSLYHVKYPASGLTALSHEITQRFSNQILIESPEWGLDHGSWSILKHLFPRADIPVLQLSLDRRKTALQHFELGKELRYLRDEGVLILASGNLVHNLRRIQWDPNAKTEAWAVEFDIWIKDQIQNRNFTEIIQNYRTSESAKMSIPTTEHFDPLFYILGASEESDQLQFDFEGFQNSTISMRSLSYR